MPAAAAMLRAVAFLFLKPFHSGASCLVFQHRTVACVGCCSECRAGCVCWLTDMIGFDIGLGNKRCNSGVVSLQQHRCAKQATSGGRSTKSCSESAQLDRVDAHQCTMQLHRAQTTINRAC